MTGYTFYLVAGVAEMRDDPWKDPGPFFAGLLWPVAIPFIIATAACKRNANVVNRLERKRRKEIDEANHKLQLAQIRSQETAELEKALR